MSLFVAVFPHDGLGDLLADILLGGFVPLGLAVDEIEDFPLLDDDGKFWSTGLLWHHATGLRLLRRRGASTLCEGVAASSLWTEARMDSESGEPSIIYWQAALWFDNPFKTFYPISVRRYWDERAHFTPRGELPLFGRAC